MIWRDLLPRVLAYVPGCPDTLVIDMLRDAAIKFCRDSHIWREQLEDLYLAKGLDRYQLALPEDTELKALISAVQRQPGSRFRTEVYPDINVFGAVRFKTVPDPEQGPLEIHAVLQPSRTAKGMPDRIGLDYDEGLIHGALERLLEIPGRDWSNPNMAGYHHGKYLEALTDARMAKATGDTEAPLRVTPQPFI